MKERPILFQGDMVRAILAGTKTQTRRMMKDQRVGECFVEMQDGLAYCEHVRIANKGGVFDSDETYWRQPSPYGVPGDHLWVREAFSGPWCMEAQNGCAAAPPSKWGKDSRIWYWADGDPTYGDWTRPRPSIHMPRWASRITLEVTGVRVERLQAISEADAKAEGGPCVDEATGREVLFPGACNAGSYRLGYRALWERINGAGSWEANPWLWVVEFKRC